jgi:cbb3-type cytochrome oxidase subunit 1
MILLASCFFIISDATDKNYSVREEKMIKAGYWIFNIFLMIFWVALIVAGAEKGIGIVIDKLTFAEVMTKINPILMVFVFSGFIMFAGILMVVIPPLKKAFLQLRK